MILLILILSVLNLGVGVVGILQRQEQIRLKKHELVTSNFTLWKPEVGKERI